jgi:DNA-binding NarL/FixJ family response regulator
MNHPIRLLIVARSASDRQALRAWVADATDIAVVGEAQGESEALALGAEQPPDVVLFSAEHLGPRELWVVDHLNTRFPQSGIVVLSHHDDEHLVVEAFREGARGCLLWEQSQPAELIEAIRIVARGGALLTPEIAGRILDELRGGVG